MKSRREQLRRDFVCRSFAGPPHHHGPGIGEICIRSAIESPSMEAA
jgi:hypothetical protein